MTDHSKPISRPRRRLLRFSVRGPIVLVLVIGAWLGWIVRIARIQSEAVKAIRQSGGWVSYYSEMGKGTLFLGEIPGIRKWLSDFIGVDYFDQVSSVLLDSQSPTLDATIAQVGRLTELDSLFLSESSVSGTGLAHIKGLTNLSSLDLFGTGVSDAGLAHLEGLTALSTLELLRYSGHRQRTGAFKAAHQTRLPWSGRNSGDRRWACTPEVARQSFTTRPIAYPDHRRRTGTSEGTE